MSADLVSEQVDRLRRRGPEVLAVALDRSLRVLHRLADDHLDATPAVRQTATAAVSDVRDLAEGDLHTEDLSESLGVDFGPARPGLELVTAGAADTLADAPWPTEDPGEPA
jgi:hypothetical protein